jgi:hypothetical protein
MGSRVYAQAGLGYDPPIYVPYVAGIIGLATMPSFYCLRWGGGGLLTFCPS